MWQVSGRSDITDFEEVVRLDTELYNMSMENLILSNRFRQQVIRLIRLHCRKRVFSPAESFRKKEAVWKRFWIVLEADLKCILK